MSSVAKSHRDRRCSSGQAEQLVAHADTHDGDGRGVHQAGEVVDRLLTVGGITGAVGDEDAVEVIGNFLNGVVIRKDGDRGATADETAQDILLDTAVNESDVEVGARRLNHEGGLGADPLDQVDLAGVDEALVLVGVVFVANRDPGERRTLFTKEGDDFAGIYAGDGGYALASAPLTQALDSSPVAVLLGVVGYDNAGALEVRRLEVLEQAPLVKLVRGHTIVPDEGLGEDQDLATVGGVGHRLRIANQGSGEDSFARDVGVGAEGTPGEDGAVLNIMRLVMLGRCVAKLRTLIVKVASRFLTGAVARGRETGIFLPRLPALVLEANRVWAPSLEAIPAAPWAAGLVIEASRENIAFAVYCREWR